MRSKFTAFISGVLLYLFQFTVYLFVLIIYPVAYLKSFFNRRKFVCKKNSVLLRKGEIINLRRCDMQKKNTAAFVLALIGSIFGLIGGILWTTCADAVNSVSGGQGTVYLVCFIILGIGGAVLSLVGGIRAYGFKKGAFALTFLGLLFQIGMLIAACVAVEGFEFLLNLCTLVAILLLVIATVYARRKAD